jgi:hypothetical protein
MKGFILALSFASCVALAFAPGCGSSSAGSDTDSGSGSSGGSGCFEVSKTGSTQTCAFESSTVSGFSCSSVPSAKLASGSCPDTGLVGCCVTTDKTSVGSTVSAACYYDKTSASAVMGACKGSVAGATLEWTTTAP